MRIRVFPHIWLVIGFMLALYIGLWLFLILCGDVMSEDIVILIIMIIMLGILPFGLLLYFCLTMTNIIEFTENGISRIRFRKVINHFNWEDIKILSVTSSDNFTGWIYLSNKEKSYDQRHITKIRLDKEVIYFHSSDKAKKAVMQFAPDDIKEKFIKLCSRYEH